MEKNRDSRRTNISTMNSFPRRRQRITTQAQRDSTDEDGQMELQETVRFRDRERLQKNDLDRDFTKRRRVDMLVVQHGSGGDDSYNENESTDSSDEDYSKEEYDEKIQQRNRLNQFPPASSSLLNSSRGLRTVMPSPVLRDTADEMLRFTVPRRARSASVRRVQECPNSGAGGFAEELSERITSASPVTVRGSVQRGASPSSFVGSLKKKMKYLEAETGVFSCASKSEFSLAIQDDIEIEVAEALFDLMKQSQSQSRISVEPEKRDRDYINYAYDDSKRLKADGEEENTAFSVQNEPSLKVNAETIFVDSLKEMKKEVSIAREKFPDDPAQELVSGDGLVSKREVGSPKESESLSSYVKVNACDSRDPTVTNANYAAIAAEARMGTKLEIDLMVSTQKLLELRLFCACGNTRVAPCDFFIQIMIVLLASPPLPSSTERDAWVDVGHQDANKNVEAIRKNAPSIAFPQMQEEKTGLIRCNASPNLDVGKQRRVISSTSETRTKQRQLAQKDLKNQVPTSWLPLWSGMSNWHGVFPRPGYMPHLHGVYPIDGDSRSSMIMTAPEFKLSQPRPKKCATHQYIASNIQHHEILIKNNLSSVPNVPATLYGAKLLNLNPLLRTQNVIPGEPLLRNFEGVKNLTTISCESGRDKSSDISASCSGSPKKRALLQQALHQVPADNLLCGPGFIYSVGQHQPSKKASANLSVAPQSALSPSNASLPSNSAGRPSFKLPFPRGPAALSFSHPIFTPSEAAPYMALLQNNGCSIPISTNIPLPTFIGGSPTVPLFDSSFYSSPVFNATHSHPLSLPHASVQSDSHNASTLSGSLSSKPPDGQQQISAKNGDPKFLNSAQVKPDKQLQPSCSSSKSGIEISWRSSSSCADGLASSSLNPYHTETPSFPVHQMNFAGVPLVSMGDGAVGNTYGDSSLQGLKDRFELPSQGFALSPGINVSAASALNLSSMILNSSIFQAVPDMVRNANQLGQPKNFQSSEVKCASSGGMSFNFAKQDCTDTPVISQIGASKIECLSGSVNFLQSPATGNQSVQSSSASLSSGVSMSVPNFKQQQQRHQHQLIQFQKHQLPVSGTSKSKASTVTSIAGSSLTSSFPGNSPALTQTEAESISGKWEHFPRPTAPEVASQSATSIIVMNQQVENMQWRSLANFGNSSVSALSFQGKQSAIKRQGATLSPVGSPSNPSIIPAIIKSSTSTGMATCSIPT